MQKRLVSGVFAASLLAAAALPAGAQTNVVRWNSGAAVYSTTQDNISSFLKSPTFEAPDRGLTDGLARSGWSAKEVQAGLKKEYNVDVVGVSRFLYSKDGVKFLQDQTRSYFPYWGMKKTAVQALRSAIILDAADGKLSSAGIMKNLPVDFRLADTCNTYDGKQNICAKGKCKGDAQCTSLLSWYVFLPACVQANQIVDKEPVKPSPVRGLW